MSDNVTSISPLLPNKNKVYRGHAYSLIQDSDGKWRAKLVVPMRPLKFERVFTDKKRASSWMKTVIDSLEVEDDKA